MKKVFSFLSLLFVGVICLTGCVFDGGDDSSKYSINVDADENIEVKTYVDYDKDYLIVYLTNNNDFNIGSIEVEAIYYDKDGNKINDDSNSGLGFIKGGKFVATLDLPHDDDYNNYVPDKIDLSVKVDQEYQDIVGGGTLYNNKVQVSHKKVGDEIEITLENTSGIELSTVEVAVLFMKNGKPIYVDSLNGHFEIGEIASETIDIPEDWEASENLDEDVLIDYDDIEIVVNRATGYDF